MTTLTILHYPDPCLRQKAEPLPEVTPAIRTLADDMAETMYVARGVGLAAPQVGVLVRMFVVDVNPSNGPSALYTCINPKIVAREGFARLDGEGCLSLPGLREGIDRAARVVLRAQGLDGKPFELKAEGLLAIALQHEYEHLDGITILDKVSPIKRLRMEHQLRQTRTLNSDPK